MPWRSPLSVVRRPKQVRNEPASYPRLILERGTGWSDFEPPDTTRYETLFDVHVDEAPGRRTLLGSIKILQRGQPSVQLPPKMSALPEDCCSLGQTIDDYAALEKLGGPTCDEILRALRDVTTDDALARAFEQEPGFRISLLRFSEAKRIYQYRPRRLRREFPPRERLELHFEATLPGFSEAIEDRHTLDLELRPEPGRIGRIAALVGENGVGKTSLLARLADALWGLGRNDRERLWTNGASVGRVIAVSYSALDVFATCWVRTSRKSRVSDGARSGRACSNRRASQRPMRA